MISLGLLGFGNVGQSIWHAINENPEFKNKFKIDFIWNRSQKVFNEFNELGVEVVSSDIQVAIGRSSKVDLVIECAHPIVLSNFGLDIIRQTDLMISSPTAFAQHSFRSELFNFLNAAKHTCYIPIGASVGLWDLIRLERNGELDSFSVTMKKHPDSFRIDDALVEVKLHEAREANKEVILAKRTIDEINQLAPQNTNTMALYALAAGENGFSNFGEIVADRRLESHIVELTCIAKNGLAMKFQRVNPSKQDAVTGSATFSSFLNSLYNFEAGIKHNNLIFC